MSAADEDMPPLHPDADRFDPGGWSRPGQCICGAALPPQHAWHDAGRDWQHIRCQECRTLFVDEEDFFAIYDDEESHACSCCDRSEGEGQ